MFVPVSSGLGEFAREASSESLLSFSSTSFDGWLNLLASSFVRLQSVPTSNFLTHSKSSSVGEDSARTGDAARGAAAARTAAGADGL